MDYLDWNNAIAGHFFAPQAAQRPVHLYITQDLLNNLGRANSCGVNEFIQQVLAGPNWINDGRLSLCGKAYRTFDGWRTHTSSLGLSFPPYINYLALFVLAAGVEGDFAPHAYYPRLHHLLGEPEDAGMPAMFGQMWQLWLDLEDWSKTEKNGDVGVFNFYIPGDWEHVGLPIGQTLLSEEDRRGLLDIFAARALDPDSPPSDTEMLALLREHATGFLQPRTRRLLAPVGDAPARRALLQAVVSELEHWDGTVNEQSEGQYRASTLASMRICCRLDLTAARFDARLRCKSACPLPEAGLRLTSANFPQPTICDEDTLGWSTELVYAESGNPVDASTLSWSSPFECIDENHSWRAAMAGSSVRLFVRGSQFGLPNYVETTKLSRGVDFLIAACDRIQQIELWGRQSCANFQEIKIVSGLPDGWRLFSADRADDDSAIRELLPRLALPSNLRLTFVGGIRTQEGNSTRFFDFALPKIQVDSPTADISVLCDGNLIERDPLEMQSYILPADIATDIPIRIEAKASSGDEARTTITVVRNIFARWHEQSARFGPMGKRQPDETPGMAGAVLDQPSPIPFNFGAALPPIRARKAYLIGRVPGQIIRWPCDANPEWQPIWVIAMNGRNGYVIPCMSDPADSNPIKGHASDRKSIRDWAEVIWQWRMRIAPPRQPVYLRLWNLYKEAARHVS